MACRLIMFCSMVIGFVGTSPSSYFGGTLEEIYPVRQSTPEPNPMGLMRSANDAMSNDDARRDYRRFRTQGGHMSRNRVHAAAIYGIGLHKLPNAAAQIQAQPEKEFHGNRSNSKMRKKVIATTEATIMTTKYRPRGKKIPLRKEIGDDFNPDNYEEIIVPPEGLEVSGYFGNDEVKEKETKTPAHSKNKENSGGSKKPIKPNADSPTVGNPNNNGTASARPRTNENDDDNPDPADITNLEDSNLTDNPEDVPESESTELINKIQTELKRRNKPSGAPKNKPNSKQKNPLTTEPEETANENVKSPDPEENTGDVSSEGEEIAEENDMDNGSDRVAVRMNDAPKNSSETKKKKPQNKHATDTDEAKRQLEWDKMRDNPRFEAILKENNLEGTNRSVDPHLLMFLTNQRLSGVNISVDDAAKLYYDRNNFSMITEKPYVYVSKDMTQSDEDFIRENENPGLRNLTRINESELRSNKSQDPNLLPNQYKKNTPTTKTPTTTNSVKQEQVLANLDGNRSTPETTKSQDQDITTVQIPNSDLNISTTPLTLNGLDPKIDNSTLDKAMKMFIESRKRLGLKITPEEIETQRRFFTEHPDSMMVGSRPVTFNNAARPFDNNSTTPDPLLKSSNKHDNSSNTDPMLKSFHNYGYPENGQCHMPNEEYMECGPTCQPSCKNPLPRGCTKTCQRACVCKPGFIRNGNGFCVDYDECDERCPDNEGYSDCKDAPRQSTHCVPGCYCNEYFSRNETGQCVTENYMRTNRRRKYNNFGYTVDEQQEEGFYNQITDYISYVFQYCFGWIFMWP